MSTKHSPRSQKPPNANDVDVVRKLKAALDIAKAGGTAGALVIALDQEGGWTADRAGRLVDDEDTMTLISARMLGACLNP